MNPGTAKELMRATLGIAGVGLLSFQAVALQPDEEFFESKIRPLLVDRCYGCHSDEKEIKGGLRLDLKAGWVKGGDSGPAILPGQPDESLLVQAIRYDNQDLQMPPQKKGKLSDEEIQRLEEWIRGGAYDPRDGELALADPTDNHWSFQPIANPPVPNVGTSPSVSNDIDSFVVAKLEENGLSPSPRAHARTLIRRVFHDLIGLPPTPEEVIAFEQDSSRDVYVKLIDELLARPQYGEKWARHWLDVARYADTKGYVFQEERAYAYAYTYRDYVVNAFNNDLPFDRFIIEQIAADQLDLGDDKRPLAAMGFLTLGRRFLNNQHDIIDDRIDVVSRGILGLTVACARCHDHKYDPIPAADYYSLYGVFASSREPNEKPLIGVEPPQYQAYLEEHNRRVKKRDDFIRDTNDSIRRKLRSSVGDYLLAAHEASLLDDRDAREKLAKSRQLDFGVQERWAAAMDKWKDETNAVFLVWNTVRTGATNTETSMTNQLAAVLKDSPTLIQTAISNAAPSDLKAVADAYGALLTDVDTAWSDELKTMPDAEFMQDPARETLRQILYGKGMPLDIPDGELRRMYEVKEGERARALQRDVEKLDATHEGAPPRAMAMYDKDQPHDPYVFKRGQPGNRGESVPRQFLEVLSEDRKPFEIGSGRLELANALVNTNNPLTARVIVNRVWMQYFNQPLVATPSDFGIRSDPPSHPRLLDHLAWSLVHEDDWSLKKLHRRILLSATYQQASSASEKSYGVDPDNRFYWRQNRKRLGFEAMRDSLLAVAGNLDQQLGGRPVIIDDANYSPRRSLYGHIDRQNLPGLFRTFDLANPDTTSPKRFSTTVPQQALFLMNSPFIAAQSRELAESVSADNNPDRAGTIRDMYLRVIQREPSTHELEISERFLTRESARPEPSSSVPDWQYGYGRIDDVRGRLDSFTLFGEFKDSQWQVSGKVPDPDHGWALLTSTGGHPGNDLEHAVVRRWTAPTDGTVAVRGSIQHKSDKGDGVRAWILAEKADQSPHWIAENGSSDTLAARINVNRGDHIDLVVDCRTSPDYDSFTWDSTINYLHPDEHEAPLQEWNTAEQFSGPSEKIQPLAPLEKLAQVLLVSNEFFFID